MFLLQGSNLLTEEKLSSHSTTLENVDEILKQSDLANGMNSSEKDYSCNNNEENEGN